MESWRLGGRCCTSDLKVQPPRACLNDTDAGGESSRGTRMVSFNFSNVWIRIGIWCGRRVVGPGVPLRNITTSQLEYREFYRSLVSLELCNPAMPPMLRIQRSKDSLSRLLLRRKIAANQFPRRRGIS